MKEEQDKWLEGILHSAQGKAPVTPSPALFEHIELQLEQKAKEEVTITSWTKNWIAVAALLVGLLNVFAFQQIIAGNYSTDTTSTSPSNYESLISDYNLYE